LVEFVGTYVSDRAIDEGLRWCDVVVAPYIGHVGSSGLINIAAQYGRPVIAQSSGQVGTEVRGHDLGVTIDARNSRDIVAAIQCFLAGTFQLGDKMDQYRRRRTYSRALDIATKALANTRTLCPAE
jgi:glycosyltransferase involved in cell wall biosynthesis